ncbi:hypothetical protein B0H13DRAFT_2365805 [Mycena leptocephala]|nr:hypothetical protein B0H13DRAFT_2365805 [Mycena leptocephala]
MAYQRQESRWGENPREFNPSRWLNGMAMQGEALDLTRSQFMFPPRPSGVSWMASCAGGNAEGHSVRLCYVTTLMPTMPDGTKGAPLCVKRIM